MKLAEVSTRVMDQLADGVVQGSMGRDGEDAGQLKLGADTQGCQASGAEQAPRWAVSSLGALFKVALG